MPRPAGKAAAGKGGKRQHKTKSPSAQKDGDAPVGEVDAVAAAREWLIAKGDFSSAAWGTGGCSLGEGKDDVVVPFSAVAAMAEAIRQLQASDQSGQSRLIFAEPEGWGAVRQTLLDMIGESLRLSDASTHDDPLAPKYVFPRLEGGAPMTHLERDQLIALCDERIKAGKDDKHPWPLNSTDVIKNAERVVAPRATVTARSTSGDTAGCFKVDGERREVLVSTSASFPSPSLLDRMLPAAGGGVNGGIDADRGFLLEWQTRMKRISVLHKEYTRFRNNVCIAHTHAKEKVRQHGPDAGGPPQSVENLLRDLADAAEACRKEVSKELKEYKAYFKAIFKGQSASARNELTAARQALGKAEDDVATRRGVRALQRTSASPGHQQLPVSDKLSGARGGDGSTRRRHGGADGDGVGADPLLAKLDKAVRDHEVALASTLTRMSELAVKHVRREELLRLEKGLANLEQQVKDLLDAPSGAAKSELTNARVREVMENSTLHDYFEFESRRVAGASRMLANELDRKEELLGHLREDPLLVALHCAAQVEIDAAVRQQREIDAEFARHELLREEEKSKAAADAKPGRRRQQHQQPQQRHGSDGGVSENGGATVGGSDASAGGATAAPITTNQTARVPPTDAPVTTTTTATPPAAAADVTRKGGGVAPATKARVDGGHVAARDPVPPTATESPAGHSAGDTTTGAGVGGGVENADGVWEKWGDETHVEDDAWETTTKKKDKAKPSKHQPNGSASLIKGMKPGDALAAAAVGAGRDGKATTRLVTPDGQLYTFRGIVCRQYLRGQCTDGQCEKQHPRAYSAYKVACDYYLAGRCSRGKMCRYAHVSADVLARFLASQQLPADGATATTDSQSRAKARRDPTVTAAAEAQKTAPSAATSATLQPVVAAPEQPAEVTSVVVPGSDEAVRLTLAASGGGVPVLSTVHLLLSTPQFVGALEGAAATTHAHSPGGCLVCSLRGVHAARREAEGGGDDDARHPLAVAANDVAVALERGVSPSARPSAASPWGIGTTVAFALDQLRCLCPPPLVQASEIDSNAANDEACEATPFGRTFGVRMSTVGATEWHWSFSLDVDLGADGGVPRLAVVFPEVALVRVTGWTVERGGWLRGAVTREISEAALLAALGVSTPPGGPLARAECAPRVCAATLERDGGATAVVLLPTARGSGRAAIWDDGNVTELSCTDGWRLLESLVAGAGDTRWTVTALLLSRS